MSLDHAGLHQLGEAAHDLSDVVEVARTGGAGGMHGTYLEEHVDRGASLEVGAVKPLIEEVEDGEELLFGC